MPKKHQCRWPQCSGRTFKNIQGYSAHLSRVHDGKEPENGKGKKSIVIYKTKHGYYHCDYAGCDYKTKSKGAFSQHIRGHRQRGDRKSPTYDKKGYPCPHCDEVLQTPGARGNHVKHTHPEHWGNLLDEKGESIVKIRPEITPDKVIEFRGKLNKALAPMRPDKRKDVQRAIAKLMGVSPNVNALRNVMCPKCGAFEEFKIVGLVEVTVNDNGAEAPESMAWSQDAHITCLACEHDGTVKEFLDTPMEFTASSDFLYAEE